MERYTGKGRRLTAATVAEGRESETARHGLVSGRMQERVRKTEA